MGSKKETKIVAGRIYEKKKRAMLRQSLLPPFFHGARKNGHLRFYSPPIAIPWAFFWIARRSGRRASADRSNDHGQPQPTGQSIIMSGRLLPSVAKGVKQSKQGRPIAQ